MGYIDVDVDVGEGRSEGADARIPVPARVRFYEGTDSGLGAGAPLSNQWGAPSDELSEERADDDAGGGSTAEFEAAARNEFGLEGDDATAFASVLSPPSLGEIEKEPLPASDVTPATSATTLSDALFPHRSFNSSLGIRDRRERSASADLLGGDASVSIMDSTDGYSNLGGGGSGHPWPAGSSLGMGEDSADVPPSSRMDADQLKYYMRRHLTAPSSSS